MKALEFSSSLNADGSLHVPEDVAPSIPPGQHLRILVLLPDSDEDQEWEQLAASQFGQGYADSDAIYDQLPGG